MTKANPHYQKLTREYIFPIIEVKLKELKEKHPGSKVLNFGIGDIVKPLKPVIVSALSKACEEMGQRPIGYGPSLGYSFLKKAILNSEYEQYGFEEQEIFISEGALNDAVNILELFDKTNSIAIPDPTYPSYLDNAVMEGRKSKITFLPCIEETNFLPRPPKKACKIVYLCSPSNPTGMALTRKNYQDWIAYAKKHQVILILDAAYESFIKSKDVPKSIYEIEGAKEVAIEIRSLSKSAGFTGLRCAYTIVPKELYAFNGSNPVSLNKLWKQRQNVKTNGVSYPVQKAAEAALSKEGLLETTKDVNEYLENARTLKKALQSSGHTCFGGIDCPYLWWKVPKEYTSKSFFELLINTLHVISIPGTGFGKLGEGFVRLSAFTTKEEVEEFAKRIKTL